MAANQPTPPGGSCLHDHGTDGTTVAGESPLVGQWERSESTFTSLDGMIIEVQGDGTTALILTVPENEYQFVAGDEKWSDIQSTGEGEYGFQDLVREENTGATSYVEGVITVGEDGKTLTMTFPTTGTTQEWVRGRRLTRLETGPPEPGLLCGSGRTLSHSERGSRVAVDRIQRLSVRRLGPTCQWIAGASWQGWARSKHCRKGRCSSPTYPASHE